MPSSEKKTKTISDVVASRKEEKKVPVKVLKKKNDKKQGKSEFSYYWIAIGIAVVLIIAALVAAYFILRSPEEVEIVEKEEVGFFENLDTSAEQQGPVSPLSGIACEDYNRRPFGVMMASDSATRQYSAGFWDADLVVEQKASSGAGIPRLMAVFVCGSPEEIGSIRSAREQYLPFAQAFDAVLVHWGGEHNILERLNSHIWDNFNALGRGGGTVFFRKNGIPKPHNGYASTENVLEAMEDYEFRAESEMKPFLHKPAPSMEERGEDGKELVIPYGGANTVTYRYDQERNVYERTWGSAAHIDVNTDEQIAPVNVVVMRAVSEDWYGQYNKVNVEGEEGEADFYMNGKVVSGKWKHTAEKNGGAQLEFFDDDGSVISFVPGQIWLNVVDPEDEVEWNL